MTGDTRNMTCAEFQEQLADLIATGEDISLHPHLEACELCRALLADLEAIAAAARELFPIADPPEELWDGIIAAIENDPQSVKAEPGVGSILEAPRPGLAT